MNAIPFIDNPDVNEVLEHVRNGKHVPCPDRIREVILKEVAKGNVIINVGDAACHPSETCVIVMFAKEAQNNYPDLQRPRNGTYQGLFFSDNKGAVEIRFGKMKGAVDG